MQLGLVPNGNNAASEAQPCRTRAIGPNRSAAMSVREGRKWNGGAVALLVTAKSLTAPAGTSG